MTILALDPGKSVGWCCSNGSTGTICLVGINDPGRSYSVFHNILCGLIEKNSVREIYIEQSFTHAAVAHQMRFVHGLVSITHLIAYNKDIIVNEDHSASTVRKWLIGRGRKRLNETTKQLDRAISQALTHYGIYPATEHAADAAALMVYAQHHKQKEGMNI